MSRATLILNGGMKVPNMRAETLDRIHAGMRFAEAYKVGLVVMSGGDAESMRTYAAIGFPEIETIAEGESVDTIENAHFAKLNLLNPQEINEVDVFTSDYHVPRTRWIFDKVLGPRFDITVYPVPSRYTAEQMAKQQKREKFQLLVAQAKLIGIEPDNDEARDKRLPHFRFRGSDHPLARILNQIDNFTNTRTRATM